MSGYIKIFRATVDHDIFVGRPDYLGAWVWLLSRAAWKPHKVVLGGRLLPLERGEQVLSFRKFASEMGWTVKKARSFIGLLCTDGMIARGRVEGKLGTRLSICNYEVCREGENSEGTVEGTRRARFGHKTEERKERKEDKKINISFDFEFDQFWAVYPRKENKAAAKERFLAIMRSGKASAYDLIDAVRRRVGFKSTQERFQPLPTTWLDQERWRDTDEQASAHSGSVQQQDDMVKIFEGTNGDSRRLLEASERHLRERHTAEIFAVG